MVAIVQSTSAAFPAGLVMPGAITPGHTLLVAIGGRGVSGQSAPTSVSGAYVLGPDGVRVQPTNGDSSHLYRRKAGAGESLNLTIGDACAWWAELDGEYVFGDHHAGDSGAAFLNPADTGSISPAAGLLLLAVATEGTDGGWPAATFDPLAGWTEQMDRKNTTDHPSVWVGTRLAPGGAVSATPNCTASGWETAMIAALLPVGGLAFTGEPGGGIW